MLVEVVHAQGEQMIEGLLLQGGHDLEAHAPHDQGLPVLKHASFGHGVNATLGLPIIRTSVDHGTALDLAGTGKADIGSLVEAIKLAVQMVQNEQIYRA